MSEHRRPLLLNEYARKTDVSFSDLESVQRFHRSFPRYEPTPLVPLPDLAKDCQIKGVFLKDESSRFGLPAFKALGASWGVFKAVASQVNLPVTEPIGVLAAAARANRIELFAATDGNHGRAVAYMARLLYVKARIFVPSTLDEATKDLLHQEGGTVIVSMDYDSAVKDAAAAAAESTGGILVQDTSYAGYKDIPADIVDGYSTMLRELDMQLQEAGHQASLIICPVGVGSLAEAVTRYYKSRSHHCDVVTVEPDTAACLYKSLEAGKPLTIETSPTIMTGMDCGTVSYNAWPVLLAGVDCSLTVSDFEAHQSVQYLDNLGISSGPCGAAGIAALRRLATHYHFIGSVDSETTVVLLNTEGRRSYQKPHDVSCDDPAILEDVLKQIKASYQASLTSEKSKDIEITHFLKAWREHRDLTGLELDEHSIVEIAKQLNDTACQPQIHWKSANRSK